MCCLRTQQESNDEDWNHCQSDLKFDAKAKILHGMEGEEG